MKVFLSHPMHGISDEECLAYRDKVMEHICERFPDAELLETFIHENAPINATRQWHLGESIKFMGDADIVFFSKDFREARGCRVEYQVCLEYGIPFEILQI